MIRLARQILSGVAFLHRNNVVHLDLKVSRPRVHPLGQTMPVASEGEVYILLSLLFFLSWNHNSFGCILTFFPQEFQLNHYVFSIASPEGNRAVEQFSLCTQSSESLIRFLFSLCVAGIPGVLLF